MSNYNKNVKFMQLLIEKTDVDEIEQKALDTIKGRASNLYVDNNISPAMAWIEAVLEYLNNEVRKSEK